MKQKVIGKHTGHVFNFLLISLQVLRITTSYNKFSNYHYYPCQKTPYTVKMT